MSRFYLQSVYETGKLTVGRGPFRDIPAALPFKVVQGPRRLEDVLKLVARNDRIRKVLGRKPELDDLDLIVAHALAWERKWQHQRKQAAA